VDKFEIPTSIPRIAVAVVVVPIDANGRELREHNNLIIIPFLLDKLLVDCFFFENKLPRRTIP
jgi:hypothetical protein